MESSPKLLGGGGNYITCNVGDVAYWDGSGIQTIEKEEWSSSLGTPIGVVVIPSNFLPDGKARIVSLKGVNVDGIETMSYSTMKWGGGTEDTILLNFTQVPTMNSNQETNGSSYRGFLPSDNFSGEQSIVDSITFYKTSNNQLIPSPYSNGILNKEYFKELSGKNVLSDLNGLSNTQILVSLSGDYIAANAAYNYSDGVSNTQWYLPSAGELGFLVVRFKEINNTIKILGGLTCFETNHWTSTEQSNNGVYYINTNRGDVDYSNKEFTSCVRPFAMLWRY